MSQAASLNSILSHLKNPYFSASIPSGRQPLSRCAHHRLRGFRRIGHSQKGCSSKLASHPFYSCPAQPQCSNIFSIKIPYPLLASCTNTWVTAPASFPSCMIGLPLTSKSSKGQQFYSLFSYTLKNS